MLGSRARPTLLILVSLSSASLFNFISVRYDKVHILYMKLVCKGRVLFFVARVGVVYIQKKIEIVFKKKKKFD